MARVIHNDLVHANAAAWHWWLAVSPYDYKDGLVYIDKSKTDGNYYPSKMLWALGNYSRFIRPGAVRVEASADQASAKNDMLLVSAYRDAGAGKLITVIVNSDIKPVNLRLSVKNGSVTAVIPYITSAEADLKPASVIKTSEQINVQPRSIITLIGNIQ